VTKPKTLKALIDEAKTQAAPKATLALPPHDPNAPSTTPPTAKSKPALPKNLADGLMGAAIGHTVDGMLSDKPGQLGMGSMLFGGISKLIAGAIRDSNPQLASTLDDMGTGAVVSAVAKAAAGIKPEPLIEEAQKAVAESAEQPPHVCVQIGGVRADPTATFVQPLVEEAHLAVADLRAGTEVYLDPENSTGAASDSRTSPAVEPLVEEARKATAESR